MIRIETVLGQKCTLESMHARNDTLFITNFNLQCGPTGRRGDQIYQNLRINGARTSDAGVVRDCRNPSVRNKLPCLATPSFGLMERATNMGTRGSHMVLAGYMGAHQVTPGISTLVPGNMVEAIAFLLTD